MPPTPARSLDVLYVHPLPYGETQSASLPRYPVIPMGAVALCNMLSARGLWVEGLNLAVERMVDPGFTLVAWLKRREPARLLLIDLHWHEHALGALEVAATARRTWPEARIVLGGTSATAFASEILSSQPEVDAVILGDAERAVLALAEGHLEAVNLATRDSPSPRRWTAIGEDLDPLDFVALDFLHHAEEYRQLLYSHPRRGEAPPVVGARGHWLSNGRGCPHSCAFCGGGREAHRALYGRRSVTWRAPRAILRDLRRLDERGIHQVALGLDPELAGEPHLWSWLGDAPPVGLYLESFGLPSTQLLDGLAARASLEHSELALSATSGDEVLRRRLYLDFDNAALLAVVEALQARRLSASVFFTLGLPGEDAPTFERTFDLARRIVERDRHDLLRIAAMPVTLDPFSPMALQPEPYGCELGHDGGLDARLSRARGLAGGTLRPGSTEVLGYRPTGDLPARIARWNALAVQEPGTVMAVPSG